METITIEGRSGVLGGARTLELDGTALRLRGGFRDRAIARADGRARRTVWLLPGLWTAIGAALVFEGRGGALRIGVQDRAIPAGERTGPPVKGVDLIVSPADFDALAAILLPHAPASAPDRGGPAVFELVRNRASGLGALAGMKPWFLTIAFLCVIGPTGGMLIGDSRAGVALLMTITLVTIATGLVATVRGATRPPAPHLLEIGRESIVLRDPKGAIVTELRKADVQIRCGYHRISQKYGDFPIPTVEISGGGRSGRELLRLGVWDSRFATAAHATKTRAPRYLVGAPEWPGLLEALGVQGSAGVTLNTSGWGGREVGAEVA